MKKFEQTIFKKYVTEFKSKSMICKELGMPEKNLNAWINLFGTQFHRNKRKIRNRWEGIVPKHINRTRL